MDYEKLLRWKTWGPWHPGGCGLCPASLCGRYTTAYYRKKFREHPLLCARD